MFLFSRVYSLHHSRQILIRANQWYQSFGRTLPHHQFQKLENDLSNLDQAILRKDRKGSDEIAKELEGFLQTHAKRNPLRSLAELVGALVFALAFALLVRQVWFENFEIPTGSMRPTYREQDHLIVRKTTFGINTPFKSDPIYFDPKLVERTSIAIWSGENIDLPDTDTTYFWLIPYKKRYVKRVMGKPGDTLYFYGGKIYGLNNEGEPIKEFLNSPWLQNLEHIPFTTFEGKVKQEKPSNQNIVKESSFRHMNIPIGRVFMTDQGRLVGQIFNGKEWIADDPAAQTKAHNQIKTFSDFWGMRNFGKARLLTLDEINLFTHQNAFNLNKAPLYLEIRHNPNLQNPKPRAVSQGRDHYGFFPTPFATLIPLDEEHLKILFSHLYTSRFVVKNEYARHYSMPTFSPASPRFPGIADGTYEFIGGVAYEVIFGGITRELPANHPLYSHSPKNIQKLFNLGIDLSQAYAPFSIDQTSFPQRFAYYRDGDLYVMGGLLFKKGEEELVAFEERESRRQTHATTERPYVAFKDWGPPLKDGKFDTNFIQQFGLKIPENSYLMLGDNHANSLDSRHFGFIPQENLEGSPSFLYWPPGERLGAPPQKPYPIFTFPNVLIWTIALIIFALWYLIRRYRYNRPLFKKIEVTSP